MQSFLLLMFLWYPLSSFDEAYLGAGTGYYNYSADGVPNYDLLGFNLKAGGNVNDYFAAELRAGLTTQDENPINGVATDINIKHYAGLYAVGSLPVHEKITPYTLLGFTRTDLRRRSTAGSPSISESDFSFGAGVDYEFKDGVLIGAEYMSYHNDKELGEIDAFTINLTLSM